MGREGKRQDQGRRLILEMCIRTLQNWDLGLCIILLGDIFLQTKADSKCIG